MVLFVFGVALYMAPQIVIVRVSKGGHGALETLVLGLMAAALGMPGVFLMMYARRRHLETGGRY
jgi:hypothetical protein